jgi:hypothetical protein
MPAGSEDATLPRLPRTYRPLGPRIVALVLVVGLTVVCAMAWIGFDPEVKAAFTTFELLTLAFLALLILACVHALTRSRVTAREDRLVVVNGYRRRELAWAQVVAIRMPPGAPWVRLDLADGSEISAMGIQGSDGGRARDAVRELRRLAAALS